MSTTSWKKCENEDGYPYYFQDESNTKQWDHPEFAEIILKVNKSSGIKYAVYRLAYKIIALQENLKVPGLRVVAGVLAQHCLSLSESSFSLEPCELEAVLTDMYFAASKDGSFQGDVDHASELTLNFLLNVYDSDRSTPVSVASVRVALAVLAGEAARDTWRFLFGCTADHNGCVSPRRLGTLLRPLALLAEFLGEAALFGTHLVQAEVDRCFAKTPGMLGLSEAGLFQWLATAPPGPRCLEVVSRVLSSRSASPPIHRWKCSLCTADEPPGLKFKCTRCWALLLCEDCYLLGRPGPRPHNRAHRVKEILDAQAVPSRCIVNLVRGIKKILNCSWECGSTSPEVQPQVIQPTGPLPAARDELFTSTVGKVAGRTIADPKHLLQDIISQLENQNKALRCLSGSLGGAPGSLDRRLHRTVDSHWGQIHTQICRLKALQENLPPSNCDSASPSTASRPSAFGVLSPIPLQLRSSATIPAVAHLPATVPAADSISSVSMSDISTWFTNETDTEKCTGKEGTTHSISIRSPEDKFNADLDSVASSNHKMKELNADLDGVLDRLHTILANNFTLDEMCFDNTQLQETANEMEGLLGSLIRGVEQRRTRSSADRPRGIANN